MTGSQLGERCRAIGDAFEAGSADVVCLQEVLTYYQLRLLAGRLPSFRHVCFRRSLAGPAGGLVTFSRQAAKAAGYQRFPLPAPGGVPLRAVITSALKGMLVTRLASGGCVVSVHPTANHDGDWSPGNRFSRLQRTQLSAIASLARSLAGRCPAVVCGDFNVARDSELWAEFLAGSVLSDVFAGRCPPTFRSEYLPPGGVPRCIDFILVSDQVRAEDASVIMDGQYDLPGGKGFLSDHVGLSARVHLAPA